MVKTKYSLPDSQNYSNQHLIVDLREQLKLECHGKQEFGFGTTE